MHLELDERDAYLIRYALAQRLKEVTLTLSLLRKIKDFGLLEVERMMLPWQLSNLSYVELIEQIDPWVSLQIHIEYLLEKMA